MPQAGARQIRQYRHSRQRAAWGAAAFAASAVVVGGAGAIIFSETDPNGSISGATGAEVFTIGNEAPEPVLDSLGRNVVHDCFELAVGTGAHPSLMDAEAVVDSFAAGCAINRLQMPADDTAAEALFMRIAVGMQYYDAATLPAGSSAQRLSAVVDAP
ncbi:MAG: hypothetical protein KIH63_005280 [Candidatus Saccharibacteria bacterium]|nr:hypothetical protein [Candidatus Saccharibacteria bacterium]